MPLFAPRPKHNKTTVEFPTRNPLLSDLRVGEYAEVTSGDFEGHHVVKVPGRQNSPDRLLLLEAPFITMINDPKHSASTVSLFKSGDKLTIEVA